MKQAMLIKWLVLVLITPFFSNAQSQHKGLNGVEYTVYSSGGTQKVKEKLYVIMHGVLKVANDQTDSIIFDSDDIKQLEIKPMSYDGMPNELADVFNKAKSGDSLVIQLPLEVMIPNATESSSPRSQNEACRRVQPRWNS